MSAMRSIGAVFVAGLLLHVAAPTARSGTYVVESCRTANGPAPTNAWRAEPITIWSPTTDPLVEDACSQEGVRFLAGPLLARTAFGTAWIFDAPPGTSVAGVRLQRYAALPGDHRADYGVSVGDRFLERSPARGPWTFGTPDVASDLRADGLDGKDVAVVFGCFPEGPGCPGAGWKVVIARAAVTLRDDAAPRVVGAPSGGLLAAGTLAGSVDVRLRYTDVGGGVDTIEVFVDGQARSVRRVGGAGCVAPFTVAVPCSLAGDVTMTLDTAQLSDGAHQAMALVTDVAGNRTAVGPYSISVRNPSPPAMSSEPPAVAERVPGTVSLVGKRTRRVKFAAHKLTGTVRAPAGGAVAGGRVELTTRPLRGGPWGAPTAVTTGRDGRFTFVVPRGPSREVRVAYGGSAQTVKLIVAAPVRLTRNRKTTRNGRTVTFSGTVPGAGGARSRVELQAWAGKWVPFKTAALRRGR